MEYFVWSANPILFEFGSLKLFWYGLLFATAILSGIQLMKWVFKKEGKSADLVDTGSIYTVIGIVVGARLAHCFFYDPGFYIANPMKIFAVWEGGLASHGGGLGAIIALYFFVKKYKLDFMWLLDRMVLPAALFAFFVRMGNLMNSEILGMKTDVSWAMIFSRVDNIPRHPAQLYEAIAYLATFFILFFIYKNRKFLQPGFLFGLFLTLVFSARFLVEFVKERQASYSSELVLNTGQALSIPFLLIGIALIIYSMKDRKRV
ncbi:MAG: prolipoprotein diacylglyceryl transferase [Campylobacterota bacterium]